MNRCRFASVRKRRRPCGIDRASALRLARAERSIRGAAIGITTLEAIPFRWMDDVGLGGIGSGANPPMNPHSEIHLRQ